MSYSISLQKLAKFITCERCSVKPNAANELLIKSIVAAEVDEVVMSTSSHFVCASIIKKTSSRAMVPHSQYVPLTRAFLANSMGVTVLMLVPSY